MQKLKSLITSSQLEEWINEHSSFLLNRAYSFLSVKEDAEDVVQEVFLSIYQSRVKYEGKGSIRSYLIAILHNKIADVYRRKYKSDQISFNSVFDEYGDWKMEYIPQEWYADNNLANDPEFNSVLHSCINKLPPRWRFIVAEAYFTDKKAQDICATLNITQSNYWKILQRCRIQLKKCLDINWFNLP